MRLTDLLGSSLTDERGRRLGRVVDVTSTGHPRDGHPAKAAVQELLYRPHGLRNLFHGLKTLAWRAVVESSPGRIVTREP